MVVPWRGLAVVGGGYLLRAMWDGRPARETGSVDNGRLCCMRRRSLDWIVVHGRLWYW